jgi:hypothetical protein
MGFLQLIPATELQATYAIETRTLLLRASGNAQKYTSDIHFSAQDEKGGERVFALMGWVGPLGTGTTPYTLEQRFENLEFPGNFVMIQTANHPQGAQVPVMVVATLPAASAAAPSAQDMRRVAVGGRLELRARVWTQPGATQAMHQDPAFLGLKSAGIQNPNGYTEIVWDLEGLKPGETEVKIISSGGLTQIVTTRTIKVLIEPVRK